MDDVLQVVKTLTEYSAKNDQAILNLCKEIITEVIDLRHRVMELEIQLLQRESKRDNSTVA